MIVADTSIWIDFFKGVVSPRIDALVAGLKARQVAVTDIIIVEVLQGFRDDSEYAVAQKIMDGLIYRPFWGKRNMERAASNYRFLRKKGITIRKPNDVVIGTFCIENAYQLLHHDQDFEPMEKFLGLQVVVVN
ncbi:MAG: PIN domain nuclease [Treponema sp.]|jgi:predicted nucleic acid-binding protein|nr:PIN domain nuclease [Treponema sp.]